MLLYPQSKKWWVLPPAMRLCELDIECASLFSMECTIHAELEMKTSWFAHLRSLRLTLLDVRKNGCIWQMSYAHQFPDALKPHGLHNLVITYSRRTYKESHCSQNASQFMHDKVGRRCDFVPSNVASKHLKAALYFSCEVMWLVILHPNCTSSI